MQLPNYDRITEEIADAELAIAWSLRGDQIAAAKKLRWVHSTAAAVHGLMTPELQASDIIVTNARAVHGPVVAEHAMSLVFAHGKAIAGGGQVSSAASLGAAGDMRNAAAARVR